MEYTSRGFIIDKIHSIGANVASASHLLEKMNKIKNLSPEPILNERGEVSNQEQIDIEADRFRRFEVERNRIIVVRRRKMAEIESEFTGADHDLWCNFKHAVEDFQFSTETYDATNTLKDFLHVESALQHLAFVMKEAFGIDAPACWPCLADRLISQQS